VGAFEYRVDAFFVVRASADLEERKKERAPEFLSNFVDTQAMEDTECRLALRYVGYPEPEVTWLFNGHVISTSDVYETSTSGGDEAVLMIRRSRSALTGDYTCRLTNKFGVAEVVARVTVTVRPQLVGRPNELDVTVGDQATFECKYRAHPTPDVYWFHNKLPLTVSRYSGWNCRGLKL